MAKHGHVFAGLWMEKNFSYLLVLPAGWKLKPKNNGWKTLGHLPGNAIGYALQDGGKIVKCPICGYAPKHLIGKYPVVEHGFKDNNTYRRWVEGDNL